jgi:periplasmic protein CpxP/Spy
MKRYLLIAASLSGLVIFLAFGQAIGQGDDQGQTGKPGASENAKGKHGQRTTPRGGRLEMLTKKLGLTDDQKTKISAIMGEIRQKMQEQKDAQKGVQKGNIQVLRKEMDERIAEVLTPEQKTKYEEMREKAKYRMKEMQQNRKNKGEPGK